MEAIQGIPISRIEPNPDQPRKHFDDNSLTELADSIKAKGLLEPIIVRPHNGKYQIVCGERRWRACKMVGLETVQAIVRECNDDEAFEFSLIENVHRDNLTPIEEAESYQSLMEKGLTHNEIAARINRGRTYVTQKMRLLELPKIAKYHLNHKELSEGHGRQLLRFKDMLKDSEDIKGISTEGMPITIQMWHIAAGDFAWSAFINNWSVSQLNDEIDSWWWNILHAKWQLGRNESKVKETIQAINKKVSPNLYPELARYIFRLRMWNISDVTLPLDQGLWHMDFWTYHSRIEKGLCWVDGCENQPTFKVKHHWCDSKDIPAKAIYRKIIRKCKQHVSRDT